MMSETIIDRPVDDTDYGYEQKIQRTECVVCHIKKPMVTKTCRACKKLPETKPNTNHLVNIPSVESVNSISNSLGI